MRTKQLLIEQVKIFNGLQEQYRTRGVQINGRTFLVIRGMCFPHKIFISDWLPYTHPWNLIAPFTVLILYLRRWMASLMDIVGRNKKA